MAKTEEQRRNNRECMRRWRENNHDRAKQKGQENYQRNRTAILARQKLRYEANKETIALKSRERKLRVAYGLTIDQYDALFASQGGVCAICRGATSGGNGWHVDHCHSTGRVRGILCFPCNSALGKFHDDPTLLRRAIEYLEAPR